MSFMLAIQPWVTNLLVVFFFMVSLLLMLIILIQRPQGGGLSGAFGAGSGSGQTAFGVKTGDALTWATCIGFGIFLITAIALNFAMRPAEASSTPAITAPPAPADGAAPETGEPTGTSGGTEQNQGSEEFVDVEAAPDEGESGAADADTPASAQDAPDAAPGENQ